MKNKVEPSGNYGFQMPRNRNLKHRFKVIQHLRKIDNNPEEKNVFVLFHDSLDQERNRGEVTSDPVENLEIFRLILKSLTIICVTKGNGELSSTRAEN